MYGGPPRPEGLNFPGPGVVSGIRSHHYSQGKHSHEWREAPAWRGREISHSLSSPAMMSMGAVGFEGQDISSEGHRVTSFSQYHQHHHQQQSFDTSLPQVPAPQHSVPKYSEKYLMGEIENDKQPVVPSHPLWQSGWRSSSMVCTVPRLYQPPATSDHKTSDEESILSGSLDYPRDSGSNNLVLHCVDMQNHLEVLKAAISSLPSKPDNIHPGSFEDLPPMPSQFYNPKTKKQHYNPLEPPRCKLSLIKLDQKSLSLLQRKSTAAICRHSGYEESSTQALNTLADVLGDYLTKLCKLLRTTSDEQAESGCLGFQDALDQSLYQTGIGGKAELHKYWQTSVKEYTRRLQRETEECAEKYTKATDPSGAKERSSVRVPSSLPLSRATRQDHFDIRLPSIWPAATSDVGSGFGEEEIPLDTVMQHANLDNVFPTKTPDLGGPSVFSQFSETAAHESEGFTPLSVDGPPRKRLRTISLEQAP